MPVTHVTSFVKKKNNNNSNNNVLSANFTRGSRDVKYMRLENVIHTGLRDDYSSATMAEGTALYALYSRA